MRFPVCAASCPPPSPRRMSRHSAKCSMQPAAASDSASLMTIPQSMLQDSKVIWTEALLRFADIDSYGHVSNRAFAEIFEGGRIDFIARRIEPWISDRTFVVIARLTIDFWNEFTFPGGARTGTWISNVGRTSATIDQVLLGDKGIVGA